MILLHKEYKEKELETVLINKIRNVLLELGKGFSFVGNQYKISVDNQDYYIDLLFYHLELRCYVVVELKASEFKPEYIGQLGFYASGRNGGFCEASITHGEENGQQRWPEEVTGCPGFAEPG